MATLGSKKVEEANEHIKEAEKSLKTGFLKWKPDYDSAADDYNKAGTCFKTAKVYDKCVDCFMKACEYYKQSQARFSAAKCLEQVILVYKDINKLEEISTVAHRACGLFQEHGSPDSGAMCLSKAAKMIEHSHPESAIELYQRACDVVMIEDRPKQGAEFINKAARMLVKMKKYDAAVDAIRKEMGLHQQAGTKGLIGRCVIALVLVHLARDDFVAADKAYREWGNVCEQEEINILCPIITAFDEDDGDAAKASLSNTYIMHMDVEYARLARDIKIPKGITVKTKDLSLQDGDGADEEEEFSGGLC